MAVHSPKVRPRSLYTALSLPMAHRKHQVLIVGAGPAGQLLGLMLAQQEIAVTIVEQASKLDENPRATHYGPPAMRILNRAGVGKSLRSRGFASATVSWRRPDGSFIAGIRHDTQRGGDEGMTALPLNQLGDLLYEHASGLPNIKYLFNCRVTSIGQDESKAWVNTVDINTDETARLEADYVVGCDGANSIIRRSLFGDWDFPGKTWDEQIVATNVSPTSHGSARGCEKRAWARN